MHDLGDVVPLQIVVRDDEGALVTATTVVCTITLPDGTTVTPAPTETSTGTYEVDYLTTMAGLHRVRWVSTGPNAAHTDSFNVGAAVATYVVSLASARRKCNIPANDTSRDDDLRDYIEATTEIVEDHTGQTLTRQTVTETVRGSAAAMVLSHTPVVSVTSVASIDGTTTWDPANLHVDSNSGVVRVKTGTALSGYLSVIYVAGPTVVKTKYRRAALIIIEHLFGTERPLQRADAGSSMYEDSMDGSMAAAGFAIPNRALELLGKPPPMVR